MKQIMITIDDYQADWLRRNHIKISQPIRACLDERMKTWNPEEK